MLTQRIQQIFVIAYCASGSRGHRGDGAEPCYLEFTEVKGWMNWGSGCLHLHSHGIQKRPSSQGSREYPQNLKEQTYLSVDHLEICQAAMLVLKLNPKKQVIKQGCTEVCFSVMFNH